METATDDKRKILTERRGAILLIEINRPEAKNAFDMEASQAMQEAMDLLDGDDSLFIGVISGRGGTFCAGADIKNMASGEKSVMPTRGGFGIVARPARKPLIAAVEGYAVGGGLEICLSCDLIVAARDARMGLPEVRYNLVAVAGGLLRLPPRIPYHVAAELALTGELRNAEYFERVGLVNRLVEPGQALSVALQWGEQLLVNGPTGLAATKEIIFRSADWTEAEGWQEQMTIASVAFQSEDLKEGVRTFAEKRKPVWKGR
jgi:enoyl-CoA hydratase